MVGASGAFVELQDSLNKIWKVERKPGSILLGAIRQRFLSFSLVLGTGVLLLVSLVSSAALAGCGEIHRISASLAPVFLGIGRFFLLVRRDNAAARRDL